MSGQTLNDRLTAARHALAGQGLARIVCKATTEEVIGPKRKHLDCKYTLQIILVIMIVFCILLCIPFSTRKKKYVSLEDFIDVAWVYLMVKKIKKSRKYILIFFNGLVNVT